MTALHADFNHVSAAQKCQVYLIKSPNLRILGTVPRCGDSAANGAAEMTYFLSSGTLNLKSINHSIR